EDCVSEHDDATPATLRLRQSRCITDAREDDRLERGTVGNHLAIAVDEESRAADARTRTTLPFHAAARLNRERRALRDGDTTLQLVNVVRRPRRVGGDVRGDEDAVRDRRRGTTRNDVADRRLIDRDRLVEDGNRVTDREHAIAVRLDTNRRTEGEHVA